MSIYIALLFTSILSMRARLLAVLILIVLLAIPVWVYYYLMNQEIAMLTISTGTGSAFSVELVWSWDIDGLPLADRALSYRQDCVWVCQIWPILPARYSLTLSSSGQIDIRDDIVINTGEKLSRSYTFIEDIRFIRIDPVDISNISSGSTWHIRTSSGSYIDEWDSLSEDIRFTDAIDLTPDIRLGYIDANDTIKLSLGNFSFGQSVLVRLDRTTGESRVVRQWVDIGALLLYRGRPAYSSSVWDIFTILD